jgi:hypothetical protein
MAVRAASVVPEVSVVLAVRRLTVLPVQTAMAAREARAAAQVRAVTVVAAPMAPRHPTMATPVAEAVTRELPVLAGQVAPRAVPELALGLPVVTAR